MTPILARILLYVTDIDATVDFYTCHFGFRLAPATDDGITELLSPDGGMIVMLHRAAKSQKIGQSCVKLVFNVEDVVGFCAQARVDGLDFGVVHHAQGYCFANARDPSHNPISVSSRAFRNTPQHGDARDQGDSAKNGSC